MNPEPFGSRGAHNAAIVSRFPSAAPAPMAVAAAAVRFRDSISTDLDGDRLNFFPFIRADICGLNSVPLTLSLSLSRPILSLLLYISPSLF